MKKIHYQNVGFPRTGTTWLWDSLAQHPEVFSTEKFIDRLRTRNKTMNFLFKENLWQELNPSLLLENYDKYVETYSEYSISMNFRPMTFTLTDKHIDRISEYTTHVSITLRNPYDMLDSFYNMQVNLSDQTDLDYGDDKGYSLVANRWVEYKKDRPWVNGKNQSDTLDYYIYLFDIPDTIRKWSHFKNNFKVFIYDDLVANRLSFYGTVCEFLGITPNEPLSKPLFSTDELMSEKFITDIPVVKFTYSATHIETINNQIDQVSSFLGRDLSHWKR